MSTIYRPGDLGIVPTHLSRSQVLRMVQYDQGAVGGPQWPPKQDQSRWAQHGFMAKCARSGSGRPVEWPPRPEGVYGSQPTLLSSGEQQQTGEEPNLTTVYPSNFKLRSEMPVEQQRAPVITSQPAFKSTKPIKMRGDSKWPPAAGQDNSQQEVREFIKPKKQCKDYTSFFAQNALSPNYTGYRAPPGTQHVGAVEEDASDM